MTDRTGPEIEEAQRIAQALVNFSVQDEYPDEITSALRVEPEVLPVAIQALENAKAKLEAEIRTINQETADDVRSWQTNAQSVQDDILRSKALANDIARKAEAPALSGETIRDLEIRADFLAREANYNQQVQQALRDIRRINEIMDQIEHACGERRILDALHLLEKSWNALDAVPVSRTCRAIKLLDIRAFELKSEVHRVLDHVWSSLVQVDVENGSISIAQSQNEPMSVADTVVGLKAYKEYDKRVAELWQDVEGAIFRPRMDISMDAPPGVHVEGDTLELRGSSDKTITALFTDLEKIYTFFKEKLPPELVESISPILMPGVISKITDSWLDSVVPSALGDMSEFEEVLISTRNFCKTLEALSLSNLEMLREWIENVPQEWLAKRRETALDQVRLKLANGIGTSREVERVEKQRVSKLEGREVAANGGKTSIDDHGWDAAWSDGEAEATDEEPATEIAIQPSRTVADDGDDADTWGWGEEDVSEEKPAEEAKQEVAEDDDDDDPTAAWGWDDETNDNEEQLVENISGTGAAPVQAPQRTRPRSASQTSQTRELILKETYHISSMPEPVLDLVFAILEDGVTLMQDGHSGSPVAGAAAGLFTLPTLALAMFRAVSPHHYSLDFGGKMYLYNDATFLAERLSDFAVLWRRRDDLPSRARNMLRLDNDVKSLQSFAARAYKNEMNVQKTVLRDLLGGDNNLMRQDETESCLQSAVARVRSMAVAWEDILARSAWKQAVGSLADTIAAKIITDVMDMPSIGQEEAYSMANMIATVTELDDLFLPSRGAQSTVPLEQDEVPTTAQFATSWLRLKFLSEVLQSNLRDVRYLWMESELSLYFSADEVVDLINLSFEDNPRTRAVVREITHNPKPLGGDA